MIVRPTEEGFLVVTQADHARLAADFLGLVRLPELVDHPHRDDLLRAVAEHDNGWWEPDAAPRVDPETGGPLDFRRIPPDLRREIWTRGVERYADENPGVAARIATHALRLYEMFPGHPNGRDDPEAVAFTETLTKLRDELRDAAGLPPEQLARDDAWLRLADEVSLAACTGDPELVTTPGWRAERDESAGDVEELRLSPFPLAGTTRLTLRARHLLPTAALTAPELATLLATSRWEPFPLRLAPASTPSST